MQIPNGLLGLHHAAELEPRAASGLVGRQSLGDEVGDARIDVELQLLVEAVVVTHHTTSCRRASIGSILEARAAGTYVAARTTAVMVTKTTIIVGASTADTPNKRLRRKEPREAAPMRPRTAPTSPRRSPCLKRSCSSCVGLAPSDTRMPISRVRCTTAYAVRP